MSYTLFFILIGIAALLLILIIMVQNPKGGGLSSSFGGQGSQTLGGVQNTTNFLDKATWTLAITLLVLILLSNFAIPRDTVETKSELENTLNDREITNDIPATPDDGKTATVQDTTTK